MRKASSLALALLITLLIALLSTLAPPSSSEKHMIIVSRVIDGDTLETSDGRIVRLLNINTPEKGKPGALESANFLHSYENQTLELEVLGVDKYQRTLGRIYAPEYVNYELVRNGLSSKFLVNEKELKKFAEAEQTAIEDGKGMWIHSPHYGCFTVDLDEKEEQISLKNACPLLSMAGWTLKDESRKIYPFPSISLGSISLVTRSGEDTLNTLYWDSEQHIWNDDRDTLYLFDEESKIVLAYAYGY